MGQNMPGHVRTCQGQGYHMVSPDAFTLVASSVHEMNIDEPALARPLSDQSEKFQGLASSRRLESKRVDKMGLGNAGRCLVGIWVF